MKALLGSILMTIGVLIAGTTGLCTATLLLGEILSGRLGPDILLLPLSGIPFLMGLGLCFAGRALIRSARRDNNRRL